MCNYPSVDRDSLYQVRTWSSDIRDKVQGFPGDDTWVTLQVTRSCQALSNRVQSVFVFENKSPLFSSVPTFCRPLNYITHHEASPHSHRVKLNPVWELRGARLNLSHVQSTALPTLYCQFHTKLPDILLDIPAIKCMATQDKWTRKIRRIDIYYVVEIKSASYVDMMDGLSAGFCPGFYKTSDYRLWKLNFLILTLLVKIQLKMVSMTRKNKLAVPFKLLNVQLLCSTTSFRYG